MSEDGTIEEILDYLGEKLNDRHGFCRITTSKGVASIDSGKSIKIKIEWDQKEEIWKQRRK